MFNDFDLCVEDFMQNTLEDSPEVSYLVTSDNATVGNFDPPKLENEQFLVKFNIKFDGTKGFVSQLYKVKTDSIYLNHKLDDLIKKLNDEGRWKRRYRVVWQRMVSDSLKFAYSVKANSEIAFMGMSKSKIIRELGSLNLDIDFTRTKDMKTSLWVDSGDITVAVNLARYSRFKDDLVSTRSVFAQAAYQNDRLQPDNTDSFSDLYEDE